MKHNKTSSLTRTFKTAFTCLSLTASLVANTSRGQINQSYHGSTTTDITLDIKAVSDGSIMVGYRAPDKQTTANRDAFITKLDANRKVVWTRGVNSGAHDVFSRVIAVSDGYIAVGYFQYTGTTTTKSKGLIVKYDLSGNIVWSRTQVDNATMPESSTSAGDMFYGVHQMASGNIVAVGSRDPRGGTSSGLVSMFSPAGTLLWSNIYFVQGVSDDLFGVNELSNGSIIVCGRYSGSSYSNGSILNIDASGTLLKAYSFALTGHNAQGVGLTSNNPFDVFVFQGDKIMIGGHNSQTYSVGQGTSQFLLKCEYSHTLSLVNSSLFVYGILHKPYNYSNGERFYPLSENDIIVTQNPANTNLDYNNNYVSLNVDARISRLNLSTSTVTYSKKISLPGNQLLLALDVKGGNKIYAAGTVIDDNANQFSANHDIYNLTTDLGFSQNGECQVTDTNLLIEDIMTPLTDLTLSTLTRTPTVDVADFVEITFQDKDICTSGTGGGDGTNCDLECYWRVTGNTLPSSSNFLGTINNMDIVIKTNNTQQAVINTNGQVGINTPAPTAKLHVECSNPPNGSNVRFENLTNREGEYLVIDPAGYVYKTPRMPQKMELMEQELEQLRNDIAVMKTMLLARSSTKDGDIISADPNPAINQVSVKYYVPITANNAYLQLIGSNGNVVKTISVPQKGNGHIELQLSDLPPQQYILNLVIDNQQIDSYKIVRQ